jgi:cell division transport system permease protein
MAKPEIRAEARRSAASPRRISTSDRFASYRAHHRQVAADSLRRLFASGFVGSLATWLVIGIAMALPGALYLALENMQQLAARWDGAAQISLFLKEATRDEDGRRLSQRLGQEQGIARTRFISRDDALAEFRELSGFGEVLDHLERNPLPAVIVVQPLQVNSDAKALLERLQALPEVEQAVLDLAWVERLGAIMALGQRAALALGLLLGLGVVLVVGNTIRLAIENRRAEIVVMKLVGATDAFVRRPFLYTGTWFGLGGGLLAWLLLAGCLAWLGNPVAQLMELYQSDFSLGGLSPRLVLLLLVGGGLLGWLGAWFAVSRHLGAIQPR